MTQNTELTWEIFITTVNYMSCKNTAKPFTRLEQELLRCYWNNMSFQDILKALERKRSELDYYYNDNYFRMGLMPNLMKKLSKLIGHSVNKKNFKEVCERNWERIDEANISQDRMLETILLHPLNG